MNRRVTCKDGFEEKSPFNATCQPPSPAGAVHTLKTDERARHSAPEESAAPGPAPWEPSTKCQVVADAWCNNGSDAGYKGNSCFDVISKRGCDSPMLARKSGPGKQVEWRCYSPNTLTPDRMRYNETERDNHCYCTVPAQIRGVLAKCGNPDPTPTPAPPQPPAPAPPPAPGGRETAGRQLAATPDRPLGIRVGYTHPPVTKK